MKSPILAAAIAAVLSCFAPHEDRCPRRSAAATSPAPGAFLALSAAAFAPHPYFVYSPRPGARLEMSGGIITKLNSLGCRGPEIPLEKAPGKRRILMFGGSGMFGLTYPDKTTIPEITERLLANSAATKPASAPAYEVLNCSVPGYTSHETAGSFSLKWLDFAPDIIIVGGFESDALVYQTDGYQNDYGHFWKVWVSDEVESSGRQNVNEANAKQSARTLGATVCARKPGGRPERQAALQKSNSRALEINIQFIANIANGNGIKVIFILPDSRGAADAAEAAALRMVREGVARAAANCACTIVDFEKIEGSADSALPAYRARAANALARAVGELK